MFSFAFNFHISFAMHTIYLNKLHPTNSESSPSVAWKEVKTYQLHVLAALLQTTPQHHKLEATKFVFSVLDLVWVFLTSLYTLKKKEESLLISQEKRLFLHGYQ